MRDKSNKYKEYFKEEHINYLREQLSKPNQTITSAVQSLCETFYLEYSDPVRRAVSKKLEKIGITDKSKNKKVQIEDSPEYKTAQNRKVRESSIYLITWAQAETPIHKRFWKNLKAYSKHLNAEIIVQAGRYKSPTSIEASENIKQKEKNKNVWDWRLHNNLYASRLQLGSHLSVLCDVKVQPTAVTPLTGLNGFTGSETTILPHPKVQLKSLPVLEGYPNKLMMSTGAVTVSNYTDTKIGHKADFHHQIGFVIAELDDSEDIFHLRQVQADEYGDFFDLWYRVSSGEVYDTREEKPFISHDYKIVFGDLHAGSHCEDSVQLATSLSNKLRVRDVVLHDVFDGKAVNHHEDKDPFVTLEKEVNGLDDLEKEINQVTNLIATLSMQIPTAMLHSIQSNHNDFLGRWLRNSDWRKTINKKMYLELANIESSGKATKGIFHYLLSKATEECEDINIKTYAYGESLRLLGWECGLHGDYGSNGSRGGIQQFKNLSTKTITGHSHTPQREDGSIIVGTLTKLRLGYNSGLSSWLNGVVIIYPNGKASNINFIKNKYTTLK